MTKLRQENTVVRASAAALVLAALVFAVASLVTSPTRSAKFVLTSGTGFSITSTISSSPSGQTAALLYPGVQRYLWYTAHNPLKVPITVTSMSIAGLTAPTGCAAANLDYSGTTFSGSLVVPALGTNSVSVPISLVDMSRNQDSCENTTFDFVYAGSASYIEIYATKTAVTSSSDESGVTYTATVTASATAAQDPVPSSPTGTVTFNNGDTPVCTNVPLSSTGTTTATASCMVSASETITAVYTNTDGNFTDSSETGS